MLCIYSVSKRSAGRNESDVDSLLRQIDEKSKSVSSTNSTIDTTKVCMHHRIFTASTSLHTCGSINRYIHFTDGNESRRACG